MNRQKDPLTLHRERQQESIVRNYFGQEYTPKSNSIGTYTWNHTSSTNAENLGSERERKAAYAESYTYMLEEQRNRDREEYKRSKRSKRNRRK